MKSERVRYLNIYIVSNKVFTEKETWILLASKLKELFGDVGVAKIGLYLAHFDSNNQCGIFRFSHDTLTEVISATSFCNTFGQDQVFIYIKNNAGTLKKAKKYLKEDLNHIDEIKTLLLK